MSSVTDVAWAAGVIDADGCISIRATKQGDKTYYQLKLTVAQAGVKPSPIIRKLKKLFGGCVAPACSAESAKARGRQRMWEWSAVSLAGEKALRKVAPYLTTKKPHAKVALVYRECGMGRGRQKVAKRYYMRLKNMKGYGCGVGSGEAGAVQRGVT